MALTIVTNNHQRDLLAGYEIPEAVWNSQFDYLGKYEESNENTITPRFFRYRDSWYDVLDGFIATHYEMAGSFMHSIAEAGWDAFESDTHFSGIAIRWGKDWAGETDFAAVVVARIAIFD